MRLGPRLTIRQSEGKPTGKRSKTAGKDEVKAPGAGSAEGDEADRAMVRNGLAITEADSRTDEAGGTPPEGTGTDEAELSDSAEAADAAFTGRDDSMPPGTPAGPGAATLGENGATATLDVSDGEMSARDLAGETVARDLSGETSALEVSDQTVALDVGDGTSALDMNETGELGGGGPAAAGADETAAPADADAAPADADAGPADADAGPADADAGPADANAGPDDAGPADAGPAGGDQTAALPVPAKKTGKFPFFAWVPALFGRMPSLFAWVPPGVRRRLALVARLWQPGPGIRENADPGGRTFAMVTIMPALLLIAWLVPGFALLLSHAFLPAPMVLIAVPGTVALAMLAARQIPGRWPAPDTPAPDTPVPDTPAPAIPALDTPAPVGSAKDDSAQDGSAPGTAVQDKKKPKVRRRPFAAWWGLLGTVMIAVAFAVWQLKENSPQFIVSRDPGAYAQFAYWIANHGKLPIPAAPTAFGTIHTGLSFASFGFTSHGASVVPGLTAGLPIVLSAGLWAHGVTGAVLMSPLLGALAVLAVGGLTGRLAGPQWAPAGAFLLALTVPEIYTSRSAFTDPLAQVLLFAGLCLVVDSFSSRHPVILATLGGVTLGLTVLAGTSFLLVLLPAIPVAGALLASRRPQGIPFTAGLVGGVICGMAAAIGLDFPAVTATTPSLPVIGILAGGLLVLTGLVVAGRFIGPVRRFGGKWLARRPLRWLPGTAAVLVVLGAVGLVARPYLQKVRGAPSPYVAALQRLESLPIDPGRLYAENTLYWVIWYLGVPALLLGFIGLAMVTRRTVRALITWQDPGGTVRALALPAAIVGWGVFAVLWQPGTVPDQPWASRQLVPVILPGLVVMAVWVAAWMIGRMHARGAGLAAVVAATACFVVALGEPPAAITFGIEFSQPTNPATRTALSGLAFRRTGLGQIDAVQRLCGAIPRNSSVLLLDKVAARAFTEVIRGTCGAPAAVLPDSPAAVDALIGSIERAGHHPVLLATRSTELLPFGASPREVVSLNTQQDAHLLTRPPTSTWPVRYVLWMSAPVSTVLGS